MIEKHKIVIARSYTEGVNFAKSRRLPDWTTTVVTRYEQILPLSPEGHDVYIATLPDDFFDQGKWKDVLDSKGFDLRH